MVSRFSFLIFRVILFFLCAAGKNVCYANQPGELWLARNGKALVSIVLPEQPSVTEQYAAAELSKYLKKISSASFPVLQPTQQAAQAIFFQRNDKQPQEGYTIFIKNKNLFFSAGSDRALLYAVYDFLHRLGCVWLAPQFSFYKGQAEFIPHMRDLSYNASVRVTEQPCFSYRKLDIEEGQSHTIENLKQLIEWMPKVRLNTFMAPLNYQGTGRVMWDNWRAQLIPELKKRGLLIEVGGHGYQNFLNASMLNGTLFTKHPDWFGKNKDGIPDKEQSLVFNTTNPEAIDFFISNIVTYIKQHPEIDIFDLWPPDGARWAESPEMAALGTPADRQAELVNQVAIALKSVKPNLLLEIIAYGQVLSPPQKVSLNPGLLVDFCPIDQTFEKSLFDSSHPNNHDYQKALYNWRQNYPGKIGLYSYYRKYAWRSVPVLLPHYIQKELKGYARLPLQAISTYAEPADWFTYELNHYVYAALTWNPAISVDSLINVFVKKRYLTQSKTVLSAYASLEKLIPQYSSIPFTSLKPQKEIEEAIAELLTQQTKIAAAIASEKNPVVLQNLKRLKLMLEYAILDLNLQQLKSAEGSKDRIVIKVKALVQFLEAHADEGVFLVCKNNLTTYLKHYNSP